MSHNEGELENHSIQSAAAVHELTPARINFAATEQPSRGFSRVRIAAFFSGREPLWNEGRTSSSFRRSRDAADSTLGPRTQTIGNVCT